MKEAVLVTGGAGYIGSHALRELAGAGVPLVALDNLSEGHAEAAGGVPLVRAGIEDAAALDAVFGARAIRAVMHFSAYAYVGESVADPEKYYRNNVAATLVLLAAMRRHGVTRFIFSSSCASYGNPRYTPLDEAHPQNPINPYGATKLMVERILADYHAAYGLEYVALRYFNAAGASPDGSIGESHRIETHLIPLALKTLTGERERLDIFGDDYDTPDGTCVRDYIHVCDLACAHRLALEYLESGGASCCINLGTGRGYSVREVLSACEEVCGKKPRAAAAPRRAGDPPVLVAANALATQRLGFTPNRSGLHDIIQSAWNWERRRRY